MDGSLLISIDFDFFVPEDMMWDLGHRESLLFLDFMWKTRPHLLDDMSTDGNEVGFWAWFKSWCDPSFAELYVSDSHAFAWQIAHECDHLLLIDAHPDTWLAQDKEQVACHTWARQWLEADSKRKMTWLKPTHSEFTVDTDLADRVKVVDWADRASWLDSLGLNEGELVKGHIHYPAITHIEPHTIHICRSGCWVPPWLDKAFIEFVNGIAPDTYCEEPLPLQEGEWDPMTERWGESDYGELRAMGQQQAEFMAKHSAKLERLKADK